MRMMLTATAAAMLLGGAAAAHEFKAGSITIEHPWARPAAKGNGAAYFVLENDGTTADRLLGVSTDVAKSAELHSSAVDAQGKASMRPVQGVDLPPGGHAQLAPGGLHVMLVGLQDPLVAGKSFPLTLRFEQAGEVTVTVEVEKKPSHGQGPGMDMQHEHAQPTQ